MRNNANEWHVVRILSDTSLIIDAGKNDIFPDEKVQVYEIVGNVEGVNGENLGPLVFIKAELRVSQVEENYSICKTPTYTSTSEYDLASILHKKVTSTKHFKMQVDEKDITPISPTSKTVCIGDLVKRV